MSEIILNGEIGGDGFEGSGEWGIFGVGFILEELERVKNKKDITLIINSPGGEVREGFGIKDALVESEKNLTTRIVGKCNSIATVVFLSSENREISKNSTLMIHNPWTFAQGDAEEMKRQVEILEDIETELVEFYSPVTGINEKELRKMMSEETELSAEEAVELGFATAVVAEPKDQTTNKKHKKKNKFKSSPVYARAYFNLKNEMKKSDKKINTGLLKQILNLVTKGQKKPVDTSTFLADDSPIFIDAEDEEDFVGAEVYFVNEDGERGEDLDEGEHELKDGGMIVVDEDSVITEFTEAEEEEPEEEDNIEKIVDAKLAEMKDQIIKEVNKAQKKQMKTLKKSFSTNGQPPAGQRNFSGGKPKEIKMKYSPMQKRMIEIAVKCGQLPESELDKIK